MGISQDDLLNFGGGGGGGGGGQSTAAAAPAAAAEPPKVKEAFDLKLVSFDAKAKIKIIKEVRTVTNLGLKEVCMNMNICSGFSFFNNICTEQK